MHIAKNQVPATLEVPGGKARQVLDFGDATGYGTMAGEYFSLSAGTDLAPLILFSPQKEHREVLDHSKRQLVG